MDIKEVLNSEEGKAAIAAAVEEATKPLLAKRDELLGEVKRYKEKTGEIQTEKERLEAEKRKAEEQAALKSGDVEKIKAQLEDKYTKDIKARDEKLASKDAALHKLLVDNSLSDALTKAGIAPQHMDVVKAYIKSNNQAEITENDGEMVAMIGGKSITDFVSEFSQGDKGKHYIAAPNNGGGGAGGSNGGGSANTSKKADMSVKQKTDFIRENGKEAYDKLS